LLGRRVLRLVQDDERVVQRVVRDEEVVGHVERIRSGYLDAERLLATRRLDAVDEPHRTAASTERDVRPPFAGETEGLDPLGQSDVEDVRVRTVVDRSTMS